MSITIHVAPTVTLRVTTTACKSSANIVLHHHDGKHCKTTVYPIPDLRFEQSFFRSLQTYANKKAGINHTLSEKELKLMGVDESAEDLNVEGNTLQAPVAPNSAPITPSVVAYAVIKDQIILPLQGFSLEAFFCVLALLWGL